MCSAQDFLCRGLCDVWSAVRNKCASHLPAILSRMRMSDVEGLFCRLSDACFVDAPWQTIEGALLGMIAIVRRFSWVSTRSAGA